MDVIDKIHGTGSRLPGLLRGLRALSARTHELLQVALPLAERLVALLARVGGLQRRDELQAGLLGGQQAPLEHEAERLLGGLAAAHAQQDARAASLLEQRAHEALPAAAAAQQRRQLQAAAGL